MIVRRVIFAVAALAALAASAFTIVIAAAFGVYALLREVLTPAGAAGAVALAAAVLAAIVAFAAAQQVRAPLFKKSAQSDTYRPPQNPIDRVVEIARDRPFVAAGAAVAAGLLAVANPALVTAVMRAFISPRPPRR